MNFSQKMQSLTIEQYLIDVSSIFLVEYITIYLSISTGVNLNLCYLLS